MGSNIEKPKISKPFPLYYADAGDTKRVRLVMRELKGLADQFAITYGVSVDLDPDIMVEVILFYSRDIEKMIILDSVAPNAYRQAAALSIWLIRLKPIVGTVFNEHQNVSEERRQCARTHINEIFALFVAFSIIHADHMKTEAKVGMIDLVKGLDSSAYDDLLSVLRFRVVSRHAIAILLQTVCEGGLRKPSN